MSRAAYTPYKWLGFAVAVIASGIGAVVGWYGNTPLQEVIFYTAATLALILWGWNYFFACWVFGSEAIGLEQPADEAGNGAGSSLRQFFANNRASTVAVLLLIGLFIILSLTIEGFFSAVNLFSAIVLALLLGLIVGLNRSLLENKNAYIGLSVLIGLFLIGALTVDGFASGLNIKSMLVFASFLGIACIGQTLVVQLGGLDLSIPFVIGAANVFLLYLIGLGVPSWIAVIIIALLGAGIGWLNGILTFRLQGQALIFTLGTGFAVSGLTQIITTLGSRFSGNVFGEVPGWLTNIAAMNGVTFGIDVPPVILVWIAAGILVIVGLRNTSYGRNLAALGGSRLSAARLSVSERRYWCWVYTISGFTAAVTGMLLLGWSGGGFIDSGKPYLFTTLAAVVIGGTSLLGGHGGYGFTVIGVLVLQVLTSLLVGWGLSYEGQQFVFGLLILPMVALYARSPHIRTQI